MTGRAFCLQRLWVNGDISSVWTGYSLEKLWQLMNSGGRLHRGRIWIEREDQPATRVSASR